MNRLEQRLLNDFQRDFPLAAKPYSVIAEKLGSDTATVIALLKRLQTNGTICRIGPVFRPNTIGVSTLAAMAVPAQRLESVAARINGYSEINHNYEREHRLNLWFVATAESHAALDAVLADIERSTGCPVLKLPLVKDYHIDLGFSLRPDVSSPSLDENNIAVDPVKERTFTDNCDGNVHNANLIEAIQSGLPLVERPYAKIGSQIGLTEDAVIRDIYRLVGCGAVKRFGVIVRHHELGYRANAMLVWDVPDEHIDELGRKLGALDKVTLCYQRPRRLPEWRYNLFCMIHGKERCSVLAYIDQIVNMFSLEDIPHAVLFSRRRFKQCGARYRSSTKRLAANG